MLNSRRVTSREHGFAFKFFRASAAHTDQMVMVPVGISGQLKAPASLRKLKLLKQPHGTQQTQGAIHGGQGYPLLGPQEPLVNLFSTEMGPLTNALKQGQNPLPLRGEPLTTIMEAATESITGTDGTHLGTQRGARA